MATQITKLYGDRTQTDLISDSDLVYVLDDDRAPQTATPEVAFEKVPEATTYAQYKGLVAKAADCRHVPPVAYLLESDECGSVYVPFSVL
jgi:hypothetical protein